MFFGALLDYIFSVLFYLNTMKNELVMYIISDDNNPFSKRSQTNSDG